MFSFNMSSNNIFVVKCLGSLIQYINIMAKELSEPGGCQVNHLMNDLKGNSEDTEIYFRP